MTAFSGQLRSLAHAQFPRIRLISDALYVPLAYMYCEGETVAALPLALSGMIPRARIRMVIELSGIMVWTDPIRNYLTLKQ